MPILVTEKQMLKRGSLCILNVLTWPNTFRIVGCLIVRMTARLEGAGLANPDPWIPVALNLLLHSHPCVFIEVMFLPGRWARDIVELVVLKALVAGTYVPIEVRVPV